MPPTPRFSRTNPMHVRMAHGQKALLLMIYRIFISRGKIHGVERVYEGMRYAYVRESQRRYRLLILLSAFFLQPCKQLDLNS